jgi:acetyl esterase
LSNIFVRSDVSAFLDMANASPAPRLHELSPQEARRSVRLMGEQFDMPVGPLAVIRDMTCEGPGGALRLRLFDARATREPGPAVIFFHGGGFVFGDLDTHAPFCAEAARQLDMPVIAVDYRLAPEHPFPAAPEDCEAAARWIAGNPDQIGRTITGMALCGDSAGGTLTIVTAMALRDRPAALPLLAQFAIYPAADLKHRYPSHRLFSKGYMLEEASMEWFDAAYKADMESWRASPLMGSQSGMPPTLVLTAALDPLRDQGRRYAKACIEQGVPLTFREAAGNIHGFINLAKAIPSTADDISEGLALFGDMIRRQANLLGLTSDGHYER